MTKAGRAHDQKMRTIEDDNVIAQLIDEMENPHGHPSAAAIQVFFRNWVDQLIVERNIKAASVSHKMAVIKSALRSYDEINFITLAHHIRNCEQCLDLIQCHVDTTPYVVWGHQEQYYRRLWNEVDRRRWEFGA